MADKRQIEMLTSEQIQELDVAQALRLLGNNASLLVALNSEIRGKTVELGRAKSSVLGLQADLTNLKTEKQTISEINRALKTIADRA